MDARPWATTLAELRYLDQEAAAGYEEAVGAFQQDSQTARELHRFRAEHARHAERIDDVFFGKGGGPEELPEDVRALLQEQVWHVVQARGPRDELQALLDAEEAHLRRYDEAAREQMPPEAFDVVREGLAEERDHVSALRRLAQTTDAAKRP
jgi:hypothetical protein